MFRSETSRRCRVEESSTRVHPEGTGNLIPFEGGLWESIVKLERMVTKLFSTLIYHCIRVTNLDKRERI